VDEKNTKFITVRYVSSKLANGDVTREALNCADSDIIVDAVSFIRCIVPKTLSSHAGFETLISGATLLVKIFVLSLRLASIIY